MVTVRSGAVCVVDGRPWPVLSCPRQGWSSLRPAGEERRAAGLLGSPFPGKFAKQALPTAARPLPAAQGRRARCAVPVRALRTGGGRPLRPVVTADPFRPLSRPLDGGVTGGAATQRSPFERAGRGRVRNDRPGYAGDRQGQCRQCRHDRNKQFHVHRGPPSRHWRCDRRMEEALFECPACKCMELGR